MTFASVLTGYTRADLLASLPFACLFAWWGYRMSFRHRLVRGVTPWRVPSAVWALICFILQPFGIVVELFAQATTKSTAAPRATAAMPGSFPAYPQRAGVPQGPSMPLADEPASAPTAVELPTGPPPPTPDGSGKTPLFGWYQDTTGRHEQRYWDGRRWSEHIRDNGTLGVDPV